VHLGQLDAAAAAIEGPGLEAWRQESSHLHAAFWRARIAREKAIAHMTAAPTGAGMQPGLFDKRLDRAHTRSAEKQRQAMDDAQARLDAAQRLEPLALERPTTALVLITDRR
jgi:hypothetical protein